MKKIYIFVEGNDDERFFKKLISPVLKKSYDDIEIIQYAQMKKEKVGLFLLSVKTLKFDYIFVADIDYFDNVNQKKQYLHKLYANLSDEKLYIAVMEIESWYLAGLKDSTAKKLGIFYKGDTNEVTKEDFNHIHRTRFTSRIDFMNELLKIYSFDTAVDKNNSFNFFFHNFLREYYYL